MEIVQKAGHAAVGQTAPVIFKLERAQTLTIAGQLLINQLNLRAVLAQKVGLATIGLHAVVELKLDNAQIRIIVGLPLISQLNLRAVVADSKVVEVI